MENKDSIWIVYVKDGKMRSASSSEPRDIINIILDVEPDDTKIIFGQSWDNQLLKMYVRKHPEIFEDKKKLSKLLGADKKSKKIEEKKEEKKEVREEIPGQTYLFDNFKKKIVKEVEVPDYVATE